MKNKNLWRIVLPLVILAVLGGIWFFKNKPKDMTEQAKPPVNADFARPIKSVQVIFHAKHGRRVDDIAVKDRFADFVAFFQSENFRHRPRRIVGLETGDGFGTKNHHSVRGFTA